MKLRPRLALAAGLALTLAAALAAEEPAAPDRLELSDFEIHQYVGSRGLSPVAIMRLDTNDEILMACRQPRTREELAAMGVDAIESQIVLLRAMRMLRLDGDHLQTLIPLLDAEATGRLRQATAAVTPDLVEQIRGDVDSLRQALAEAGFGAHAYPVLFSYVLDGMVWDFFEEYGEVRPRRLSAASPHWAGEIWGTRPPRDFAAGTSSILAGDLSLRLTRPAGPGSPLDPVLRGWRSLRDLLRRYADAGEADAETAGEPAVADDVARWGLVDANGELTVPVVVEKPGQTIFEAAQRISEKVSAAATERLDLEELGGALGLRDRPQTLIVAYHELMWDLMEALESAGLAPRPRLLVEPGAAGVGDVAQVAVVVDARSDEPAARRDEVETDEE